MFKDTLAFIGMIAILTILIFSIGLICSGIKEIIHTLRRRYKYKHRFDKPPTAKCYCVDCRWHNNKSGRCYRFFETSDRLVADNFFCDEAEPKK